GWRVEGGGNWGRVGTEPRNAVGAFEADTGAVTSFRPIAASGGLWALAVTGATVYVAGTFVTDVSNPVIFHLAGFQDLPGLVGGVLTSFQPNIDNEVLAVALSGSTVYAGGSFTSVGVATPRQHLAAFEDIPGTAGGVTPWDPDVNQAVLALALSDPTLYVAGDFTAVHGAIPRPPPAPIHTGTGGATRGGPAAGRAPPARPRPPPAPP